MGNGVSVVRAFFGFGIILSGIIALTYIERYALSLGVNGHGLLAFFGGMSALISGYIGYSLGKRKER